RGVAIAKQTSTLGDPFRESGDRAATFLGHSTTPLEQAAADDLRSLGLYRHDDRFAYTFEQVQQSFEVLLIIDRHFRRFGLRDRDHEDFLLFGPNGFQQVLEEVIELRSESRVAVAPDPVHE